ncbi:MAG: sulfotransferase [Pseudomonadota bacterium]
MIVFQIGFNKCATTALYHMFKRARVMALHGGGRYWRRQKHPAIMGKNPQLEIHNNIVEGRAALTGFADFQAFFDMEYVADPALPWIENFRHFRLFAEQYHDARFILNTRDKAAWLRSRARHNNGRYIRRAMERTGRNRDAVLQMWSEDWTSHHAAVRTYFADKPGRLIEFNIDHDDPQALVDFFAPEMKLRARHWAMIRVTDEVAKDLN